MSAVGIIHCYHFGHKSCEESNSGKEPIVWEMYWSSFPVVHLYIE